MVRGGWSCPAWIAALGLVAWCRARAADTIETWDPGPTDVELYAGVQGLGPAPAERGLWTGAILGYGLVERLSACFGATFSGDEALANGEADLHMALLGTPVDTDHFDLDLVFLAGLGGRALSAYRLGPLMEVNVDGEPDRSTWGGYLRLGVPMACRQPRAVGVASASDEVERAADDVAWSVAFTPGASWRVSERHELLLEYEMAVRINPLADEPAFDVGRLALGNNTVLSPALELVTEVSLELPEATAPLAAGMMVGVIATLPGAAAAAPRP